MHNRISGLRAMLLSLGLLLIFATEVSAASRRPSVVVPPGWPKQLVIPKMQLRSNIEALALTNSADVRAPYRWEDVAWYDRGPRPGDTGRASIYGHLDSYCCPAAFYRLRDLNRGDVIYVVYQNHQAMAFRVQWRVSYWNNQVPMKFIFGATRERGLILMTCTGDFHQDGIGYDHKMVVYAKLARK